MKEKTLKKYQCKRCGYFWYSQLENPKQCPKCKQYNWNTEKKK